MSGRFYTPSFLTELRDGARLSQAEAAQLYGLNGKYAYQSVSAWEDGTSKPRKRRDFLRYLWQLLVRNERTDELTSYWEIVEGIWKWAPLLEEEIAMLLEETPLASSRLPKLPSYYVQREINLTKAIELVIRSEGKGVALVGFGGVGKTVLSQAIAYHPAILAHFSDGVLWTSVGPNIKTTEDVEVVLRLLAEKLGIRAQLAYWSTPESKAQGLAEHLKDKQMLIIADDVWHSAPARLIKELVGEASTLLITTRSKPVATALNAVRISVQMMTKNESLAMFENRLERAIEDHEREVVLELVQRLKYHPLAVLLAAAQLSLPGRTWKALLTPLRDQQGDSLRVLELDEGDREASLQICFAISYAALSELEQRCYKWLGTLATESVVSAEDLSGLWTKTLGAKEDHRAELLALLDASLLEEAQGELGPTYKQHALLREHALHLLGETDLQQALLDHARYYESVLIRAKYEKRPDLVALAHPQVIEILWRGWRGVESKGNKHERGLRYDDPIEANYFMQKMIDLATPYWGNWGLNELRLEWAERGLETARVLNDLDSVSKNLGHLGSAHKNLGHYSASLDYYGLALFMDETYAHDQRYTKILTNAGKVHLTLGEIVQAIELLKHAFSIQEVIKDDEGLLVTLDSLADAYMVNGQRRLAREMHERHADLAVRLDNDQGVMNSIWRSGRIYHEIGDLKESLECLAKAKEMAETTANQVALSAIYGDLAKVHFEMDDADEAITLFEKQIALSKSIGHMATCASGWWNLGLLYEQTGDLDKAIPLMKQAVDWEQKVGHAQVEEHAHQMEELEAQLSSHS